MIKTIYLCDVCIKEYSLPSDIPGSLTINRNTLIKDGITTSLDQVCFNCNSKILDFIYELGKPNPTPLDREQEIMLKTKQ